MRSMETLRGLFGKYEPIPRLGTVEPADANKKKDVKDVNSDFVMKKGSEYSREKNFKIAIGASIFFRNVKTALLSEKYEKNRHLD